MRHPYRIVPVGNSHSQTLQTKLSVSDSNGIKSCPSGHFVCGVCSATSSLSSFAFSKSTGGTATCCSPSTECIASAACSGWASVSCVLEPESLSAFVGWRMSSPVPQSKTQCHGLTDSQCVYTDVYSVYRYMRLACKTKWYSDLLIQLLDTVIHYVADGCCSECPTMSYLLYSIKNWMGPYQRTPK